MLVLVSVRASGKNVWKVGAIDMTGMGKCGVLIL